MIIKPPAQSGATPPDPPEHAIVGAGRSAGPIRLTVTDHPQGALVVSAEGQLDLESAEQFREHVLRHLSADPQLMIVCLRAVSFLDSSGLSALVAVNRRAETLGVAFRIVGPTDYGPTRVLHLTGLDQALAVYPSLDQALGAGTAPA